MTVKDVLVPDLGTGDAVDVIEITVKPGDKVEKEQTILVLESDKATVEVPSPFAGVVKEVVAKVGQQVKQGDRLLTMDSADAAAPAAQPSIAQPSIAQPSTGKAPAEKAPVEKAAPAPQALPSRQTITVNIPDIGGGKDVDVIEVVVKSGDVLAVEQTMLVLESDKATMEIPSPQAGVVQQVLLKTGDKVSMGTPVLTLEVTGAAPAAAATPAPAQPAATSQAPASKTPSPAAQPAPVASTGSSARVHAGPAVRKLARDLGVDLGRVTGTGPRNRIIKDDVHNWVKQQLGGAGGSAAIATGSGLPPLPVIDFSQFGPVEQVALSRINKLSASNLHRAWVHVPHVTQFDEADITDLEAFRTSESGALKDKGVKLTILAFLVKACARALLEFPRFNSSLQADGEHLVLKQYVHIGIAVDTPNGLVVPVIRDADKKSLVEIAQDMQVLSQKARDKKLSPGDMQGACFSISSLGGIGGTAFTPIVNWPEVAILGVSRSQMKPLWDGKAFQPRLMLPLSLSYDHRVIDGADAARFTTWLSKQLTDIRRLLL